MLKNVSRLEHIIDNRVYHFTCEFDSPLGHVKDAVIKFLQYIVHVEEQVAAQQKAAEEQKQAVAEEQIPIEEPVKEEV